MATTTAPGLRPAEPTTASATTPAAGTGRPALAKAWPRVGAWVVAAWLAGIVTNLVIKSIAIGGRTQVFWDIALRDFGLMLAAIALARLAAVFAPRPPFGSRTK